jgi:NAD(P)-dependent dehydrogenase (short-subunit alcohol dehydrogenase family)
MKKVLITGGSKGIGLAMTQAFCREGYEVVSTYNTTEPSFLRPNVKWIKLNLLDRDALATFVQSIDQIDILIHNAGLGTKTVEAFSQNRMEQDEIFFKINVLAPMWLTERLLPKLQRSANGKVIFISSVGGGIFHFPRFRAADGMSKAALTFFAKQLSAELSQSSVDVFTICPGATETDMFRASTLNAMDSKTKAEFISNLPKQRLIQPEEVAGLAVYLASDHSKILHGAVLDASLGLGSRPGLVDRL